MSKLFFVVFFFLACPVWADDIPLSWKGDTQATGYHISRSADQGATWTQVADVPHDANLPVDKQTTVLVGEDCAGLVLYKIAAYNAAGESPRNWSGAWANCDWKPLSVGGMGVE
jgi:hypothetical protein